MKLKFLLLILFFFIAFNSYCNDIKDNVDTLEFYGNKNQSNTKNITNNDDNKNETFLIRGGSEGYKDINIMRDFLSDNKKERDKNKEIPKLPTLPDFIDIIKISKEIKNKIIKNNQFYNGSSTYKYKKNNSIDSIVTDDILKKMQDNANFLTEKGIPMKIFMVKNDSILRNFVDKNILKKNGNYKNYDSDFISAFSMIELNGENSPVCYIMLKDSGNKNGILTLQLLNSNKDKILDYVLLHQIAHCLDDFELQNYIKKNEIIYAKNIVNIGVIPEVFSEIYPYGMTKNEYKLKYNLVKENDRQKKYEEFLADLFAFNYINIKYNDNDFAKNILKLDYFKNYEYKNNILKIIAKNKNLKDLNIKQIWSLSRKQQVSKK